MGIVSLLLGSSKKKKKRRPPTKPRAPRSAVARALRHTAAGAGSRSAAELGQRIATSLSTIETAVLAIDTVGERLREALDLVHAAMATEDPGHRALFAGRYDDLRAEIDAAVGSASHNRINLINGRLIGGKHQALDIELNEDGRAGVAVHVVNLTTGAGGLELSPPRSGFAEDEELSLIAGEITAAQTLVTQVSERFLDHAALIADRLARLQSAAGPRSIEPELPTGADAASPEDDDLGPIELGITEIEHRLRLLAERDEPVPAD
ncbi:hypothetical protein [Parvibaculum sp.]|uniref:hypothetical protein n=1 Tax=Parvibaculum sp. TaxID=2024848 RepID=UPI0032101F03